MIINYVNVNIYPGDEFLFLQMFILLHNKSPCIWFVLCLVPSRVVSLKEISCLHSVCLSYQYSTLFGYAFRYTFDIWYIALQIKFKLVPVPWIFCWVMALLNYQGPSKKTKYLPQYFGPVGDIMFCKNLCNCYHTFEMTIDLVTPRFSYTTKANEVKKLQWMC